LIGKDKISLKGINSQETESTQKSREMLNSIGLQTPYCIQTSVKTRIFSEQTKLVARYDVLPSDHKSQNVVDLGDEVTTLLLSDHGISNVSFKINQKLQVFGVAHHGPSAPSIMDARVKLLCVNHRDIFRHDVSLSTTSDLELKRKLSNLELYSEFDIVVVPVVNRGVFVSVNSFGYFLPNPTFDLKADDVLCIVTYILSTQSIADIVSNCSGLPGLDPTSLEFATNGFASKKLLLCNENFEYSAENVLDFAAQMKAQQKTVAVTNGCLDIIHAGHVRSLVQAKQNGDVLVVVLNTDASIRRNKGTSRPINCLQDRINVMLNLPFVDYVVAFDEDSPKNLYSLLIANVLVKGDEYKDVKLAGQEFFDRVVFTPNTTQTSTSKILNKIKLISN
jgi:rfaE bifunctional protein nucleotidyltransferase chain/domain